MSDHNPQPDVETRGDSVEFELRERLVVLERALTGTARVAGMAAFAAALALLLLIVTRRQMSK